VQIFNIPPAQPTRSSSSLQQGLREEEERKKPVHNFFSSILPHVLNFFSIHLLLAVSYAEIVIRFIWNSRICLESSDGCRCRGGGFFSLQQVKLLSGNEKVFGSVSVFRFFMFFGENPSQEANKFTS
jgi:hypothetical protein